MTDKKSSSRLNLEDLQIYLQRQFGGLDAKDPSLWPVLPRVLLYVATSMIVAVVLWFVVLQDYVAELETERSTEVSLRADYQKKLLKAVSLDALKKQREQVQQYVLQLEKQLPSKAEMAALLSDINQAGLGRGLDFDLFRPGQVDVKEYYAELPIAIRVTGRYHDIGAFTGDIANLSRIVTLHNLNIASASGKDNTGALYMEATARTYRYLDPAEIEASRAEKNKKAGGK